ncbi:MAG: flagellar hook-associated protein FlgK [Baekduia sp.]
MTNVPAFNGLGIALRGVQAQQRGLDVTGHNIANVETEGYSRQEAVLAAARPLMLQDGQIQSGGSAQLGQGVDVQEYRRLRNDFLDLQWRAQQMNSGEADAQASKLLQIEAALNDSTESGLGQQLSAFYSAWSALASNPESTAAKTALFAKAQTLIAGIRSLDQSISDVSTTATNERNSLITSGGPIDLIAREIKTLNDGINGAIVRGEQPNDLLDRRDLLLDKLSEYGSVSISVPDGTKPGFLRVTFGGAATPLVDNAAVLPATAVTLPTTGTLAASPGGKIEGLQTVITSAAAYRGMLDTLASRLVTQVNGQHGSPAFFDGAGTAASTIALGASLTGPAAILAGSGAAGDNSIALAIAGQRSSTGTNPTTDWASLVTRVGSDVAEQKAATLTAQRVLDSLSAQRASTHGVSLDEEMTNMMRFQRGYQAAARALTAMDENLDILINRTGRVGL